MPPQRHNLVDVPPINFDVMGNLHDLMSMGAQMRQGGEAQRQEQSKNMVEQARMDANGDAEGAATFLAKAGKWAEADALRKEADEKRRATTAGIGQVLDNVNKHASIYGKAAEIFTNLQAKPERFPQMRPALVDLASQIDPRLAEHIPQQYDAGQVSSMLKMVTDAGGALESRSRALEAAKVKTATRNDVATNEDLDRKIVSNWFSVSQDQEDWDASLQHAKGIGVSDDVLGLIGPTWSPEAAERARTLGLTAEQREKKTPVLGSEADAITTWAKERGLDPSALTSAQKNQALGARAAATRAPQQDPFAGLGQTGATASVTGDEFLKTLPPGTASEVKAYAEGRRPFPTGMSYAKLQPLIQLVGQYDPTFDATNYNGRNKARQDFTAGSSAKQITALNTVIGHLGDLDEKASSLGNGSIQWFNGIKNWVKTQTGSSDVTNFNTVRKGVTDELTRVWRQAGGAESDIKTWAESLNAAQSPEQLQGAFSTIAGMLQSRLDALENQKQQGLGRFGDDLQIITPKSKGIFERLQGTGPAKPGATATSAATPDYGYGFRYNNGDPSTAKPKGLGFLGPLLRSDGGVMSEFSIGVDIDGKETEIPTLVPTLTEDQVKSVLSMKDGDKLPAGVAEKATAYAKKRIADGKDPFAGPGEQQSLYPKLKRAPIPSDKNRAASTERRAAAAAVLQQNGRASDDASVTKFLQLNPDWKP